MREPVPAYIALGANLGEPQAALRDAIGRISQLPGVRLVKQSAFYRTAPVDAAGPDFVNAVVVAATVWVCATSRSLVPKTHWTVGLQARLLAIATSISPTALSRWVVRHLAHQA